MKKTNIRFFMGRINKTSFKNDERIEESDAAAELNNSPIWLNSE